MNGKSGPIVLTSSISVLYSNASAISLVKDALENVALQSTCTLFELTKPIKVGESHR